MVAVGLVLIWPEQLRTLALFLVAVAIVLATKELIRYLTGGFLKMAARSFPIGDRVEVNNLRGDVINQTMLTTTIMEIGPGQLTHQYTGRSIALPSSIFLSAAGDQRDLHRRLRPAHVQGAAGRR